MTTLTSFLASVIKRQYRKNGIFEGHIYLTERQSGLYNDLLRQLALSIESQRIWAKGNWTLFKDGADVMFLTHRSLGTISWSKRIDRKSISIVTKREGKLSSYWINSESMSIVNVK